MNSYINRNNRNNNAGRDCASLFDKKNRVHVHKYYIHLSPAIVSSHIGG